MRRMMARNLNTKAESLHTPLKRCVCYQFHHIRVAIRKQKLPGWSISDRRTRPGRVQLSLTVKSASGKDSPRDAHRQAADRQPRRKIALRNLMRTLFVRSNRTRVARVQHGSNRANARLDVQITGRMKRSGIGESPKQQELPQHSHIIAAVDFPPAPMPSIPATASWLENDRFARICIAHGSTFVGPVCRSDPRQWATRRTAQDTHARVGVRRSPEVVTACSRNPAHAARNWEAWA